MAGTGKKWLIGCGAGCAASILLSILLSVGGAFFLVRPMNKAVDAQRELTEVAWSALRIPHHLEFFNGFITIFI